MTGNAIYVSLLHVNESHLNALSVMPSIQMFIFDKIAEGNISTSQFEIGGATYAPEGEV